MLDKRSRSPCKAGHQTLDSLLAATLLLLLTLVGCGAATEYEAAYEFNTSEDRGEAPMTTAPASEAIATSSDDAPAVPRKVIYTANVSLVVKDFAETDKQIQALTQEFGGFLAEFREDGSSGDQRSGRWVVRTPVNRFQEFLDRIVALGVPETRQINTQDVTEEFVDLEARLSNKRKLEARIIDLLENQAGKIQEVIAVETELGRVREEIERMEGRLRFLANRVDLTTITILAREDFDYVPPQAPTFLAKVDTTWSQSLIAMGRLGEGLALIAVALAPWLVVLALLGLPVLVWRARRSRR
jgi:uncharacterized coiled-coil protein SlyX